MKTHILLLILLLFVFILRVEINGGIEKEISDPESQEIGLFFESVRNNLAERISYLLPQPQAGLLSGMLLGVKEDLPSEFKKALRETSTIHIVVVSGQNLTLVAGFVLALAPLIGRKKTITISLIGVVLYALLTGLQIPVIRAAIMVFIGSVATLMGREREGWWILSLTILLMLIFNPNWLLSISFQLSVLATIGVVVVAPVLIQRFKFIPEVIKEDLAVSLAAQLLTLPIIAANFHQVSMIGILVNSLILWTIAFVMISGGAAVIISLIIPILSQIIILVPGVLLTYFVYIVNFFANIPGASLYIRKVPTIVWIGYYLFLAGIFLILKRGIEIKEESLKLLQKAG